MNLPDMFTLTSLTAAIRKLPAAYSVVGGQGLFTERGVRTTSVLIESDAGRLRLVPDTNRSIEPVAAKASKRVRRTFTCAHLPETGVVMPDEVQGVSAFGSETAPQQQATVINDKLQAMRNSIDATVEYHRIGAIKGVIYDADGSTVLHDLYSEFGISARTANVAFTVETTDVRKALLDCKRHAETKLEGVMVRGFKALCGPAFFDALTNHPKVQKAYESYQAAMDRIGGDMRKGFTFGDIEFIEVNVQVGSVRFIPTDKAYVYPVGAGVFHTFFAPANYNETVNTIGQNLYAKSEPRKMGKGWDLEAQSNPLAMNLFPESISTLTAA
jgi:hypothetical protein